MGVAHNPSITQRPKRYLTPLGFAWGGQDAGSVFDDQSLVYPVNDSVAPAEADASARWLESQCSHPASFAPQPALYPQRRVLKIILLFLCASA